MMHFDAFGQSLWDEHRNGWAAHVVEREDGYVDPAESAHYFHGKKLPPNVERALREARGRVLDIGCGAGRHAIPLQRRGCKVLGIDESPLAIKTARARGLKRGKVLPIERISKRLGTFDTLLLLGHNFGLLGNRSKARRLLRMFLSITPPDGQIIAESNDVYETTNPVHLAYQRMNRRRGRMSGQIRLRVRYKQLSTPFMDYLMVSPDEMKQIVAGTGWRIRKMYRSRRSSYVAVLVKE